MEPLDLAILVRITPNHLPVRRLTTVAIGLLNCSWRARGTRTRLGVTVRPDGILGDIGRTGGPGALSRIGHCDWSCLLHSHKLLLRPRPLLVPPPAAAATTLLRLSRHRMRNRPMRSRNPRQPHLLLKVLQVVLQLPNVPLDRRVDVLGQRHLLLGIAQVVRQALTDAVEQLVRGFGTEFGVLREEPFDVLLDGL